MKRRYPGPQSFQEDDEAIFYGRERETKALHDLILAQSPVVLFSKSGMGKTSLLQAGVIPRLFFSEFDPIKIRLNDTSQTPEQQTLKAILPNAAPDETLWEVLHRYRAERFSTPILIFDQFEELFTLYPYESQRNFVRQLADVVNGKPPATTRNIPETAPRVRIVLSIRSDLLHYLHALSSDIPSVLRNRFELKGLRPQEARKAMEAPAALGQEEGDFESPIFNYEKEAIDQILNYLSKRGGIDFVAMQVREAEIESFQLQLLCQYIEKKIIEEKSKKTPTVTRNYYGGEAGIEKILSDFYKDALASLPEAEQAEPARRFVEDHLVQNNRRVSVSEDAAKGMSGLTQATIDYLVDKRLLRRDIRETGSYLELSHDTLLAPAIQGKKDWEEEQARIKAEKELAEQERLLGEAKALAEIERKRLRNARMLSIIAVIGLAAALVAMVWAFRQQGYAEEQKNVAEKALNDFKLEEQKRLKLEDEKERKKVDENLARAKNQITAGCLSDDIVVFFNEIQQKYPKDVDIGHKVLELNGMVKEENRKNEFGCDTINVLK